MYRKPVIYVPSKQAAETASQAAFAIRARHQARAIAASVPIKDVEIEHEGALWRDLIGGLVGKVLFSERLRLDGLISLWHPSLW